jgi:hypothetical protein
MVAPVDRLLVGASLVVAAAEQLNEVMEERGDSREAHLVNTAY